MKITIEIHHASNNLVLLCDLEDSVVGLVGDSEIYGAILHRREVMKIS